MIIPDPKTMTAAAFKDWAIGESNRGTLFFYHLPVCDSKFAYVPVAASDWLLMMPIQWAACVQEFASGNPCWNDCGFLVLPPESVEALKQRGAHA